MACRRETRFDVERDVNQFIERALHFGSDNAKAGGEVFCFGVVAFGLHAHDFARERGDAFFYLVAVDRKGAVGLDGEGAGIEQII